MITSMTYRYPGSAFAPFFKLWNLTSWEKWALLSAQELFWATTHHLFLLLRWICIYRNPASAWARRLIGFTELCFHTIWLSSIVICTWLKRGKKNLIEDPALPPGVTFFPPFSFVCISPQGHKTRINRQILLSLCAVRRGSCLFKPSKKLQSPHKAAASRCTQL